MLENPVTLASFRSPLWLRCAGIAIIAFTLACPETDPIAEDDCPNGEATTDASMIEGDDCATDPPNWPKGQYPIHQVDIAISTSDLEALTIDTSKEITVLVALTLNGQTFENVNFELHGGFAKGVPKKSFRLELPDDLNIYPNLFGDGPEKQRRFVLLGAWIDPTYLRHKITMDLIRESGGLSPRVSFARMTFNGEYYGLFQLVERIDKLYLERQGFRKSGNLYKAENHNANWQTKSDPLKGYDHQSGEENSTEDLGILLDTLTYTETTYSAFEASVATRLELEDFFAWQRVLTFAMEQDSYTKNYYLYHDVKALPLEPEDRFRVVAWDADATWGVNWNGDVLEADDTDWYGTDAFSNRILSIDEYRNAYLADYSAALDSLFSKIALEERIDTWANEIHEEALEDREYWERTEDFEEEVTRLKDVATQRHILMSETIDGEQLP